MERSQVGVHWGICYSIYSKFGHFGERAVCSKKINRGWRKRMIKLKWKLEYTRKRCLQCKNFPFSTPCKEIMTMETRIPFHSYIFYILRKMFNSSCFFFFFFSPSSLLVSLFTVSIASPTRSLSLAPLLSSSHEFFNCLIEL